MGIDINTKKHSEITKGVKKEDMRAASVSSELIDKIRDSLEQNNSENGVKVPGPDMAPDITEMLERAYNQEKNNERSNDSWIDEYGNIHRGAKGKSEDWVDGYGNKHKGVQAQSLRDSRIEGGWVDNLREQLTKEKTNPKELEKLLELSKGEIFDKNIKIVKKS